MRGFNGVTVAADGVSCSAGLDGGEAMSLTPLTPSQYGFPTAYRCDSTVSPQYVAIMGPLTHTHTNAWSGRSYFEVHFLVGGSTAAVGLTADEAGRLEPRRDWFRRSDLQLALGAGAATQLINEAPNRSGGADSSAIHQVATRAAHRPNLSSSIKPGHLYNPSPSLPLLIHTSRQPGSTIR